MKNVNALLKAGENLLKVFRGALLMQEMDMAEMLGYDRNSMELTEALDELERAVEKMKKGGKK